MSNVPEGRNPGSSGYNGGNIKRWLDPAIIAIFSGSFGDVPIQSTVFTTRILLRGLSGSLLVHIGASILSADEAERAAPAVPGTMQLTPIIHKPNQPRLFMRPVFQDPAGVAGANTPLAQNLPFGWEFSTEADEVAIDITVTPVEYETSAFEDSILQVQVTVEYNGQWMDENAIKYVMSRPRLDDCQTKYIDTGE